jgi:hypothetical protein
MPFLQDHTADAGPPNGNGPDARGAAPPYEEALRSLPRHSSPFNEINLNDPPSSPELPRQCYCIFPLPPFLQVLPRVLLLPLLPELPLLLQMLPGFVSATTGNFATAVFLHISLDFTILTIVCGSPSWERKDIA